VVTIDSAAACISSNPHLRPSSVSTELHDIVVSPSTFPTSSKLPHIIYQINAVLNEMF
jgi:hypothetical protein